MISYGLYKLVHFLGIFLVLTALAGMALHAANGGARATSTTRRLAAAMHGLGAFLILLGGFGMLARLGLVHGGSFPGWLWAKIGIWLLLGAAVALPYRRRELAKPMLVLVPLLAVAAAAMALYKPF